MFKRNGHLYEEGGSRTVQRKQWYPEVRSLGARVADQRSHRGPSGSISAGHVAEFQDGGCPRKGSASGGGYLQ